MRAAVRATTTRLTTILKVALAAAYALCACLIVAWVIGFYLTETPWSQVSIYPMALAGILLVLAAPRVFRPKPDERPLRELEALVGRVRRGEAPIDELSSVEGELALVAGLVAEICRDLRQQRAEVMRLEEEMHQRVAQRTDALERMVGTLRQQATRDALTGLFNRRFLETYLPQAMQRCRASKADLTVLMIDLDHFKCLNDTLGHVTGDQLLRAVGQIIRSGVRGEDVPFRYGGDEFVILLPGCGPKQGQALADRLSRLVEGLTRGLKVPKRPGASIGVVAMTSDDTSPADLLRRADEALYEQKRLHHSLRTPSEPLQNAATPLQSVALNAE